MYVQVLLCDCTYIALSTCFATPDYEIKAPCKIVIFLFGKLGWYSSKRNRPIDLLLKSTTLFGQKKEAVKWRLALLGLCLLPTLQQKYLPRPTTVSYGFCRTTRVRIFSQK